MKFQEEDTEERGYLWTNFKVKKGKRNSKYDRKRSDEDLMECKYMYYLAYKLRCELFITHSPC